MFDQGEGEPDMPHAINVTPEEQEAIERVYTITSYFQLIILGMFFICYILANIW